MLAINLTRSVFPATLLVISWSTLKIPCESFSFINFPIPCNWQQLSSLLKPTDERKRRNLNENKCRRTIQNVCLVTMQSFNEWSLDSLETFAFASAVCSRIVWYFLAHSGEISVEVIGYRRCGGMEVPWQLDFNFSKKGQNNETVERTTGEQESGLEPSWRFWQTAHLGANESDDQQQS